MLDAYDNSVISEELFLSMLPEIKQNAKANVKAINDTFQWVKTQYQGFSPQLEQLQIYSLFTKLNDQFQPDLQEKGIALLYNGDEEIELESDRILLTFILKKVIENAIKYSDEGKNIYMQVSQLPSGVQLIIEDQGTGMSVTTLSNIFNLESAPYHGTQGEKGAGLSLIIVKDFVKLLGGSINAYSAENEGTKIQLL